MNVLTWFGAVLRVDADRNRLIQEPIWMTTADGLDFNAGGDPAPSPLGPLAMQDGDRANIVHFQARGLLLTASAKSRDLTLEPEQGELAHTFLLVQSSDLADLRHILNRRWRLQPSGQVLQKADIAIGQGFMLTLGTLQLDLANCLPLASSLRPARPRSALYVAPPAYQLRPGDPVADTIELADAPPMHTALGHDVELIRRPQQLAPELPLSPAEPRTSAPLPLAEPLGTVLAPPIVVSAADRALFATLYREGAVHPGLPGTVNHLRHESQRFVCLSRGAEGLVFDRHGTSSDVGHVEKASALPTGFHRQGGRLWLDSKLMDQAPRLRGPHVVFYDPALDGVEAWLGGAIPALSVIAQQADRHARALLPAKLDRSRSVGMLFDHREIMAVAGFAQLEADESDAPIVCVEDLLYVDRPTPGALPAYLMRELRDRILARFDGRGEAVRRIYLRPAGANHGRQDIERFLLQQSFEPVQLDHMPFKQQVELFRSAAFVVGSHGAGLANILFAPPGLRILELTTAHQFQPDIWLLATKLGHLHGLLGCPGPEVDTGLFRDLYQALENFRL